VINKVEIDWTVQCTIGPM